VKSVSYFQEEKSTFKLRDIIEIMGEGEKRKKEERRRRKSRVEETGVEEQKTKGRGKFNLKTKRRKNSF